MECGGVGYYDVGVLLGPAIARRIVRWSHNSADSLGQAGGQAEKNQNLSVVGALRPRVNKQKRYRRIYLPIGGRKRSEYSRRA